MNDSLKRLQTDYIDLINYIGQKEIQICLARLGYEHKDNGEWNKFEDVLGNLKKFVDARKN